MYDPTCTRNHTLYLLLCSCLPKICKIIDLHVSFPNDGGGRGEGDVQSEFVTSVVSHYMQLGPFIDRSYIYHGHIKESSVISGFHCKTRLLFCKLVSFSMKNTLLHFL